MKYPLALHKVNALSNGNKLYIEDLVTSPATNLYGSLVDKYPPARAIS